jgi:Ca-activated chloride channel family protein
MAAAVLMHPVFAQNASTFRTDAKLVLVPVTVTDRRGGIVNGLSPKDFTVMEDKVTQPMFSFIEQDSPVSIGVILDVSGSVKNTLAEAKAALRTFFEISNLEDEAFLYTVSTRPQRQSGFTREYGSLLSEIMNTGAEGDTALVDTVYNGLNEIKSAAHARKALVIVSDGMDNHSRYTKAELMRRARELDVQIYAISLFDPPRNKKAIEVREEQSGLLFLDELADGTGGFHVVVRDAHDLSRAATTISWALRNQYVIGYIPRTADRNGKWHSIQVKLSLRDARAHARAGYRSDDLSSPLDISGFTK